MGIRLKYITTIFSAFIAYNFANCQTPINKVFGFEYFQTSPFKIVASDSLIIISGTTLVPELAPERSLFVAQFDKDGNYLTHANLIDENEHFAFTDDARDVIKIDDKIFVSSHEVPWTNRDENYFDIISSYDLNANEIEVHHVIRDTSNLSNIPFSNALTLSPDRKLVVLLSLIDSTDYLKTWLQKVDPDNKNLILDEFMFGSVGQSFGGTDIVVKDDEYIVLGYHRNDDVPNYRGLFTLRLNESFDLLELKTYDNLQYFSSELNATQNENREVIFLTQEFEEIQTTPFLRIGYRPIITKLDENLEIVWQTNLGYQEYLETPILFTGIVTSHYNNGYIICGYGELERGLDSGLVAKINEDGDSVWVKSFIPLGEETTYHDLFDISKSPDGSYVLTGRLHPTNVVNSTNVKGWLLKIDEEGKVFNTVGNSTFLSITEKEIKVFPNPVSDVLFIETEVQGPINLVLRNSNGQIVLTESDLISNSTYYLDTQKYPSGIYFLTVEFPTREQITKQIIISN